MWLSVLSALWLRNPIALLLASGAFVLIVSSTVGAVFEKNASAELSKRAHAEARLRAASLQSELDQLRDFPTILANDPEVSRLLDTSGPNLTRDLNLRLEQLTKQTRARFIYLISEQGLTLSSSNWRTPESFVGQDYSFRPYFREAMANGEAKFFALGTITGEPGLFIARRVESPGGIRGVVVVKVLFDALEEQWAQGKERIIVTDENGIAILSTDPDWLFRATRPISPHVAETIRESRQFGYAPDLTPFPLAGSTTDAFAMATLPVPQSGWGLTLYVPGKEVLSGAALLGRVIGALAATLAAGFTWFFCNSLLRSQSERRDQERARAELEREVTDRTRDLRATNHQLQQEIADRKRVETNLQLLQDELFQANRLAVLGQISAGVAHEINQPLAAVRALCDSAVKLIELARHREASENLHTISKLADRIAAITDELRTMSRKGSGPPERVKIIDALEGALLLVSARLRAAGIVLERDYAAPNASVVAHKMRLEQVILNLLQNAIDATSDNPAARIRVSVRQAGDTAFVSVEDDGPGMAPATIDRLFTPFYTTKQKGLGLGLVISQDICREYGGQLFADNSDLGGAMFTISLSTARDD